MFNKLICILYFIHIFIRENIMIWEINEFNFFEYMAIKTNRAYQSHKSNFYELKIIPNEILYDVGEKAYTTWQSYSI